MVLAHVAVAVARELDDPARRDAAGRELLVVHGAGAGHVERVPAGVGEPAAEVDLVGVDEERRVEVADLVRGLAADEHRRRLHPVDRAARPRPLLCTTNRRCRNSARQQRRAGGREAPGRRLLLAVGADEHRARGAGALVGGERGVQRDRRARLELGVLVEQQAEAPARALQQRGVVAALPRRWGSAITSAATGCWRATSTEPSWDALSSTRTSVSKSTVARSRAIASRQ